MARLLNAHLMLKLDAFTNRPVTWLQVFFCPTSGLPGGFARILQPTAIFTLLLAAEKDSANLSFICG